MKPAKKSPPLRLVKTLFVVLLPFVAIWIAASIIVGEFIGAFRSIYLEFRVEIASAREQWRKLP